MARPKSASSASTPAAAAAAAAVAADALAAKANTASEKAAAIAKDKPTTANKKKATTAANKARLALDAAATAHAAAAQAALAAAGLASASLAIADSPTTSSRTSLTETPANVGNVGTAAKSIASNGSKQSIPPRAPFSGAMVSPPLPPPHVPPPHRPAETSSDRREDVIMGEINDDDDALSDLDQFTDADVTPAPRSSVNKEHNRQAPSAAQSSKQATDPSRNRDYFQQDYEPHVRDHYHPNAAQPAPPSDLASALAFLSQMLAQNAPRHEKISSSEDFLAMTTQLGHGNTTSQQALANVTTWASGMPSAQQLGSVGSTLSAVGASPSSNGHHTIHPADMASPPATSRTAQVPAALPSSRDPASGTVTAVPESASLDETETGESILLYIRAFLFLDNLFPVGPTSGKSRWLPELRAMTGLQTLTGPDLSDKITSTRSNMLRTVAQNTHGGLDVQARADIVAMGQDGEAAGVTSVFSVTWCETVMFSGSTVRPIFRRWLRMFLAVHTKPPMCQLMDGIIRWWAKWDVEHGVDPPRSSDIREYAVRVCVGVWLASANVLADSAGHLEWKQKFRGHDHVTAYNTSIAAIESDQGRVQLLKEALGSALHGFVSLRD